MRRAIDIDVDSFRLAVPAEAVSRLRAVADQARALLAEVDADIAAAEALGARIEAIRLRRRLVLRRIARAAGDADLVRALACTDDPLTREVIAAELERRRERAALDRELNDG